MLVSLLVLLVVLCIVAWIISVIPFPPNTIPFKTIAYIVLAIVAIIYILRITGVSL